MRSKFPKFSQWKQIFKVLKKSEKITLVVFLALAIISLGYLVVNFYVNNTKSVPALGGMFNEGVVGQPRFINPIYGETNDTDRSIIDLVFSGLMTYDKDGKIVNDLVDSYQVSDDGKTYNFTLKNNIFWHDGVKLTVDDVIFTIKTIQNSDYKSPLRANWIDVNSEKTSDNSFALYLDAPYNSFLESLTLKIIPKHIWQNIPPENFALSSYNLQPIGSGPFEFIDLKQTNTGLIKTLHLQSNRKYYGKQSFISDFYFQFFDNRDGLIKAADAKQIDGFSLDSFGNNQAEAQKTISQAWLNNEKYSVYNFSMPRYLAAFFNNQKSSIFSDINVRQAAVYSVNKNEVIKKINSETKSDINIVDSPIIPEFYGYQKPDAILGFDIDAAKKLLDKAGFKDNGLGKREKTLNKKPAFQFKSYLKIGSKGTEVAQLQGCLNKLSDDFKNLLKNETNGTYGKGTDAAVTLFQQKYLAPAKPTGETGQTTRLKLNQLCISPSNTTQPLKFTITTINQPQLVEVANLLKDYWQNVGMSVDINAVSITDLKPIIKDRNYDILLYGQALGIELDPYPFWYSSQKLDPGLNLSSYENKDTDQLLKDARETLDPTTKEQKLEKLQSIIINDAPALFLYNPSYIYWISNQVKGIDTTKIIDPAKRFANITDWYMQTKRVLK